MQFNTINGTESFSDNSLPAEASKKMPVEVKVALTHLNKDRATGAKQRRAPTRVRALKGFDKKAIEETKKQSEPVIEAFQAVSSSKSGKLNMAAFSNIHKAIGNGPTLKKKEAVAVVESPVEKESIEVIEKKSPPSLKLEIDESNERIEAPIEKKGDSSLAYLFHVEEEPNMNYKYVSLFSSHKVVLPSDTSSMYKDFPSMERQSRSEVMNEIIARELYPQAQRFDMAEAYIKMTEADDGVDGNFAEDYTRLEKVYAKNNCIIS